MQAFRLSFYLTLALATLCLGVAETFFLSWILVLVAAACIIFWLAYRYEGRWILTASAANGIGLFIGILSIGWIVSRVPRTEEEFLAQGVPWPAGMLPHLGPMLILLTTAKVFRPKGENDFWVLQALGMMMVMLASVLAGEVHHALFLFLYLVSLFWCLTLHDRSRAAGTVGTTGEPAGALFQSNPTGSPRFGGAVLLASLAFLLGIGIFYVAPRQPANQWLPYKLSSAGALNTPLITSRDSLLDLNHVGKVELSDEIAFDVTPLDADGNRPNLPADMYWRTETLDYYRRGRWMASCQQPEYYLDYWPEIGKDANDGFHVRETLTNKTRTPQSPFELPREPNLPLPPDKVYLAFRLRPSMGEIVHAEHLDKREEAGVGLWPRVGNRASANSLIAYEKGYDVFYSVMPSRRATIAYGQIWDPATRLKPQPPLDWIHSGYRAQFLLQTPPAPEPIGPWTRELLTRLAGISAAERTLDAKGYVLPANQARIARALSSHLSDSGEYLYSLDLRLINTKIDPLADFLMNVKEGHCERYASGLVLMLRSVGIPSRLVKGFHGLEKDDKGDLHVRYSHAHSWVEALVRPGGKEEVWITLDPTPSQTVKATGIQAWFEWFNDRFGEARRSFRRNVVEFGVDEQTDWYAALSAWLMDPWTAATLGGVLAIAVGIVFLWRRRAQRMASRAEIRVDWMRSFLRLAERHCREPRPDETWSEYIATLRFAWRSSLSADLSSLLCRFADSYNQLRFGQPPLDSAREAELADGVKRLRRALEKNSA